jgi:hypothetical protein
MFLFRQSSLPSKLPIRQSSLFFEKFKNKEYLRVRNLTGRNFEASFLGLEILNILVIITSKYITDIF